MRIRPEQWTRTLLMAIILIGLVACEKQIEVDLPDGEVKMVVEGSIELDRPPLVILTRTQSFFEPTDLNTIAQIFVDDAMITVSDGMNTIELDRICSEDFPSTLLPALGQAVGLDPDLLAAANICFYTDSSLMFRGQVDMTYTLRIEHGSDVLTSTTTMPAPVDLDSLWFRLAQQDQDDDTSGYIWARLSDPPGIENSYRWKAQRLNRGPDGRPQDPFYIAPLGAAFNDQFFDGLELDFFVIRGTRNSNDNGSDFNRFFTRGDTVATQLISMGPKEYDFYFSYDNNVASQGDLFSTPANVVSNIEGDGIGIWAALAPSFDTVVCIP